MQKELPTSYLLTQYNYYIMLMLWKNDPFPKINYIFTTNRFFSDVQSGSFTLPTNMLIF